MIGLPSRDIVEQLRKSYPQGTRVELINMNDPYTKLKPGDRGTVSMVDDTGTCGSGLGVVYGEDHIRKI